MTNDTIMKRLLEQNSEWCWQF